jgi:hypothetical protein
MYSSKLVDLFYRLTKKQQRALKKFVRSPYYNKRQDVVALFDLLYTTPLENRLALKKENVSQKIYPNAPQDVDKVDYLMSFLSKLIEQFLVQEQVNENSIEHTICLMRAYRRLGMSKHFEQQYRKSSQILQKRALRDINYHEKVFALENERYDFLSPQKREATKNLQLLSQTLDLRFLAQKLKDACRLLAHQAVVSRDYDFGLLDAILEYLKTHQTLLEHPAIASYYYFYLASKDAQKEGPYFYKFKDLLQRNLSCFKTSELEDLYTLGVNYCVKKINIGQSDFEKELFEMYNLGLELGFLIQQGKLNHFKFNNICKLALRLGKISWTQEFIEIHQPLLAEKHRKSYINNAWSMLYFAKGDYDKTLLFLQEVGQEELFITMDTKIVLIKVFYMQQEYDALEALLNSFAVYIRRKEVLAYHREIYKNFIRYVQKIIRLAPYDKIAKKALFQEIKLGQKILEKKWLLACLNPFEV